MENHNACSSFRDNIPAYAIGALDADEASALVAHLESCEACQNELAGYRAIENALLTALPSQKPPAALRTKLQRRLPGPRKISQPRYAWSLSQHSMVAAISVLIILNLIALLQVQSLQRQQKQLGQQVETNQAALAMLVYPETQTFQIAAEGVNGILLINKEQNSVAMVVWQLPQLSIDQDYQLWLIDAQGQRTSAGVFHSDPASPFTTVAISSSKDLSNFVGLGMTVEPVGGSNQPTGPRIFRVGF